MKKTTPEQDKHLRDGKESLPEPADIDDCLQQDRKKQHDDENLDEALIETFPASDPPASGRFEQPAHSEQAILP
ncbi:hypothetical protein ABID16_001744 [Rhizobium aquaticum]|uniref:Uncharacterized protein n=1 Tax=Rhizobium aquaticum TaxID=1549636 RepID=A0ABV2J059_9HYPH